jgi:hypothetical protein
LEGGLNVYLYTEGNPILYMDQTGLFLSEEHRMITRVALVEGKCENLMATLPDLTAGVDFLTDSGSPRHAHWHAMSNGEINESREDARRKTNNYIEENLRKCNADGFSRALHAEQDEHSSSHNYQPWYGGIFGSGIPGLRHLYHDMAFGASGRHRGEATRESVELIRRLKGLCPCLCKE